MPPELQPHASPERFARAEESEQELRLVRELENWLAPSAPLHLDTPRATLRVVCTPKPDETDPSRHRMLLQFLLLRPRTGEKARSLHDLVDLVVRAAHEQELFTPWDWEFIQWIYDTHRERCPATRLRYCSLTRNCCNGSRAGATPVGSNSPPPASPSTSTAKSSR